MAKDLPMQSDTEMSISCPRLGRKVSELLSLTRLLLLYSCGGLRNRIMHVFTDGASKSLAVEYLLTSNKTNQNKKTLNFTFFFFSLPDAAS